jgi:hypothetical protein
MTKSLSAHEPVAKTLAPKTSRGKYRAGNIAPEARRELAESVASKARRCSSGDANRGYGWPGRLKAL